jgi:uncharacterized membrane protein
VTKTNAPHAPRPDQGLLARLNRAAGRLTLGVSVGLLTATFWPAEHSMAVRVLAGWDAGAFMVLAVMWAIVLTADPRDTKRRAAVADPGRRAVWVLVILASAIGLFAGAVVMRHAATIDPTRRNLLIGLCLVAVMTAWTLTHTVFTLRYAHLYYRSDERDGEGGLEFLGKKPPSDLDFAYFAFTVGMCFQVSDVGVSSPQMRRAVLSHALLSFVYNTAILALSLNLLVGALG